MVFLHAPEAMSLNQNRQYTVFTMLPSYLKMSFSELFVEITITQDL